MELLGTVQNGVIVPDDPTRLPQEGTRVRIEPVVSEQKAEEASFLQRFGEFMVDDPEAPTDLASQHEHYRLGVPKR
ncbi:MAG: hypothetical protein RMJ52_04375 [Gemmataceae bacterium]|nr:hypothetical protein [Gemmataceae bacterium]